MTPNEIHNKQFDKGMSGYRIDDVVSYLADVANYVEGLLDEKSVLEQKMLVLADKLEEYREDEDSLRAALIGAQKLGDSVVRESKRKAEQILADAQQKADAMVLNIRSNIDRETDILNKMQAEVARFKGQILSTYKQHIESINSIPYDEKDFGHVSRMQKPIEPPKQPAAIAPIEADENAVTPQRIEAPTREVPAHKDFVVTIEDELEFEEVEIIEESASSRKESRHGDLLFGEKYTLTRRD